MKTLLILRHAKSSWKDSDIDDHERPLNKRGKRDAPKIGRLLANENLLPDLIVSSSAKRCRKTVEQVIQHSGYRGETHFTSKLYEATALQLRDAIADFDARLERVLLIGHNPGLEQLLEGMTGIYMPLTTAALAQIVLPVDSWKELTDDTRGTLTRIWQPAELED